MYNVHHHRVRVQTCDDKDARTASPDTNHLQARHPSHRPRAHLPQPRRDEGAALRELGGHARLHRPRGPVRHRRPRHLPQTGLREVGDAVRHDVRLQHGGVLLPHPRADRRRGGHCEHDHVRHPQSHYHICTRSSAIPVR